MAGRFTLMDKPQAMPGNCIICGKHDHEKGFIDTSLHFDYVGAIVFCYDCLGEMARMFNFASPEDVDRLEIERNSLNIKVLELSGENERLIAAVREQSNLLINYSGSSASNNDIYSNPHESQKSDKVPENTDFDKGSADSSSVESVTEQGPDDLSDNGDDELNRLLATSF